MKKFITGIIVGALLTSTIAFAASYIANPPTFKVLVNGKEFISDPPTLVVEGNTYLPLRAMGDALGVPVKWNEELRQVEVGTSPASNTYIAYDGYDWCPDFGKYMGVSVHADFDNDDGGHTWIYKANGITNEKINQYAKIITNNGFEMRTSDKGLLFANADRTIMFAIWYTDNNEIMISILE